MLRRIFWAMFVFSLGIALTYAYAEEKTKYVNFDYKNFCKTYSKNNVDMTDIQFEDWFSEQKQKYVRKNTHVIAEGYIFDVKKDNGHYKASISYGKGFF